MLNKTNAINNIEWKQKIINNAKKHEKENEEMIQGFSQKTKNN